MVLPVKFDGYVSTTNSSHEETITVDDNRRDCRAGEARVEPSLREKRRISSADPFDDLTSEA